MIGTPDSRGKEISVRPCATVSEYERCGEIQRSVWGYNERDVVPSHVFVVASKTGGQVLGAFADEVLIGFVLAFAAFRDSGIYLHSHLAAVLPQQQDRGVGRMLKLAQRDEALARDIGLIEWTFDPLAVKNAKFNIARLGAIACRYVPNQYGCTSSHLHGTLPTDRLVAEWWLDSARVEAILEGVEIKRADSVCVSIPADANAILRANRPEALQLQAWVREQFESWFAKGYAVTGFELSGREAHYLLEPRAT
jgi:predicted GNAT superfamily acetyltransferase